MRVSSRCITRRWRYCHNQTRGAMRRVKWLMVLTLMVLFVPALSQNRMANWVFGDSMIVQFTPSGPVLSGERSSMRAYESAASISNSSGELVLYSNGVGLWNRNHTPLLGSEGISTLWFETGSPTTGGTLFIPASGDTTDKIYWLLTIDFIDRNLKLSEVNLDLGAGIGGINPDRKNIVLIPENLSDQLVAVRHGNGLDWWIVCRLGYPSSSNYCSVLLTSDGILGESYNIWDAKVTAGAQGEIAISPDGNFLAFASGKKSSPAILSLYDFNRCDGSITFMDTILFRDANKGLYGVAFSNSGDFIYCSTFSSGKDIIYQVSRHEETLSALELMRMSSPGTLAVGNTNGQFELGPDRKVYFTRRLVEGLPGIVTYAQYLGVIHQPDEYGVACQLDTFGFYLGGYVNNHTYSLPNFANYDLGPLVGSPCDTLSPPDTTQTGLPPIPLQNLSWSIHPSVGFGFYTVTGQESGMLVVHDLYGREVLRQWHEGSTTFDLTAQPAGLYLVYLQDVEGRRSIPRKILRQ